MTSTIQIVDVSHRYGSHTALERINLTIEAGRFLLLLGPSGCGKTTLLSILGGFLHPSEGRVLLDDRDITTLAPAKRPTTTMFQDYALFPHMSVMQNVAFGLRMRGQSRRQRESAAQMMLELVGLSLEARKRPHELSGGQRQRVALARALAVKPDVLLLDEPLGALDLNLRRQMQDELKTIQQQLGTTFVHVTHDQEEAMAVADDIVVMNAGRVEDHGSPEAIYLRPRTLFSARFMGDVNLVAGRVVQAGSDALIVDTPLGQWSLPAAASTSQDLSTGAQVSVCFRPEQVVDFAGLSPAVDEASCCLPLGDTIMQKHAFFGTHQRCLVQGRDGRHLLVHLPQGRQLAEGQLLQLGARRESVVVLHDEAVVHQADVVVLHHEAVVHQADDGSGERGKA